MGAVRHFPPQRSNKMAKTKSLPTYTADSLIPPNELAEMLNQHPMIGRHYLDKMLASVSNLTRFYIWQIMNSEENIKKLNDHANRLDFENRITPNPFKV